MWTAITLVTIALSGTIFLLWFLRGLLRERAPLVSYWVVPLRTEKASGADSDTAFEHFRWSEFTTECHVESLENEVHANPYSASRLVAIPVCLVPDGLGNSPVQPADILIFREYRRL